MQIKKPALIFAATIVAASAVTSTAVASPASALTEDQESAITQSCQTIKQTLKSLQRADSKTRSYLGSAYQTFLTDYIAPLNLNLATNNRPSTSITSLYSDILDARKKFVEEFTSYSQSFEELLLIDCQKHPDKFYEKLEETRKKRSKLEVSTKGLRSLLGNYRTAVEKLREDF